MTAAELKNITSQFEDIKPLLKERKDLAKHTKKIRRKLKTKITNYSFLKDLVDIDAIHTTLDNALKKYFNALGFKKVECVDNGKVRDEDVRLWLDDRLIIFEATGSVKYQSDDNKIFQI